MHVVHVVQHVAQHLSDYLLVAVRQPRGLPTVTVVTVVTCCQLLLWFDNPAKRCCAFNALTAIHTGYTASGHPPGSIVYDTLATTRYKIYFLI